MTLDGLLNNAKNLQNAMDSGQLAKMVLERHSQEIVEQQRIQLLGGKTSEGEDIHPSYSEDIKPTGYFRSRESASRYAAWKQTLSYPYSVQRNADSPNLYITGVFHNDLGVEFGADSVAIVPDTAYASNIMAKYGRMMFGLAMERWGIIWNDKGAKDELISEMENILWQ